MYLILSHLRFAKSCGMEPCLSLDRSSANDTFCEHVERTNSKNSWIFIRRKYESLMLVNWTNICSIDQLVKFRIETNESSSPKTKILITDHQNPHFVWQYVNSKKTFLSDIQMSERMGETFLQIGKTCAQNIQNNRFVWKLSVIQIQTIKTLAKIKLK